MIIAHRGGVLNTNLIENTLDAFHRAFKLGYGIECDLQQCRSGEIVIHHDLRTKDGDQIALLTKDELPSHVPTLHELLVLTNNFVEEEGWSGILNLEIKTFNIVDTVCKTLQEFPNVIPHVMLSSFLHTEMDKVPPLADLSSVKIGYIFRACPRKSYITHLLNESPQNRIVYYHDAISNDVRDMVDSKWFLYTVNSESHKLYYLTQNWNVITDRLTDRLTTE